MKFRKNNKGFSLVELIIVIAIMVALIAVMAPQFTKYIEKSRQAAFDQACEDYLSAVKSYYSDPDTEAAKLSSGTIVLTINSAKQFTATKGGTVTDDAIAELKTLAGLSESKKMTAPKDKATYTITITAANGGFTITMA